jgi:hypothetical protein
MACIVPPITENGLVSDRPRFNCDLQYLSLQPSSACIKKVYSHCVSPLLAKGVLEQVTRLRIAGSSCLGTPSRLFRGGPAYDGFTPAQCRQCQDNLG